MKTSTSLVDPHVFTRPDRKPQLIRALLFFSHHIKPVAKIIGIHKFKIQSAVTVLIESLQFVFAPSTLISIVPGCDPSCDSSDSDIPLFPLDFRIAKKASFVPSSATSCTYSVSLQGVIGLALAPQNPKSSGY